MNPSDYQDDELKRELDDQLADLTAEELEALVGDPLESSTEPDERGRVRGRILQVRGTDVFVDLGGKSEAFLAIDEFPENEPPQPGQVMSFMMQGLDRESGLMRLSLREARSDANLKSLQVGDVIEARVTGVNIGGLELTAGKLRAFMPKSQVEMERIEDFAPYVGRKLECEVTEVDRRGKRVVVSHRRILEKRRDEARAEAKATLEVGQRRAGTVRRLTDFGAFVDIGGIDGLLHVSDMSWGRVAHPKDVVKEGQQLQVEILKIDHDRGRISLGMKQLEADPWDLAGANYRAGQTVDGKVTKLMDFGAFVELEPGIEGLIPISEMSWTHRIRHPRDVVNEGASVRVAILSVDTDKRKIGLSLKAMSSDPWEGVDVRFPVDQFVEGKVTRIADFGAFVELGEGIEGLVHVSELSDKRIRTPRDVVQEGQDVRVRVKQIDLGQRRISLSMKEKTDSGEASAEEIANVEALLASREKTRKRKRPLRGGLE